ncbi:MAG TPA: 2-amino-4-hydroxy-6-hydroxymethyldihydropteridine diphosphokinase [Planctomycetaceae bacterium]|nr:2-amino-4-hydroxy-6-hydroxymethyldihydropteridine diphosphokinase [Planctomycetaceae bacterium]
MNRAFLALGSNIDPERNLPAAVRELARFGRIVRVSNVWESPPADDLDQPDFLNAAVLLETPLSADALWHRVIPEVEQALGRVRDPANKNASRTIDVDLSLFNRETLVIDDRRLPNPDLLSRAFVAVPLAELDAAYVHPQTGRTLAEIAASLSGAAGMRLRSDVVLATGAMAPTSAPPSSVC